MIRQTLTLWPAPTIRYSGVVYWLASVSPTFSLRLNCRYKHIYPTLDESELEESFVRVSLCQK